MPTPQPLTESSAEGAGTVDTAGTATPASEQAVALGRAVKAALVAAGRTQADLGVELDLSQQAVSRRLTGEVELSASELRATSAYLGIRLGLLLDLANLAEDAPAAPSGGAS